jgi:hypothetical protein
MAYTESFSSRDLRRLQERICAAQRSETPSEFEGFSGPRIQAGESGSSSQPFLLAMLGAPYASERLPYCASLASPAPTRPGVGAARGACQGRGATDEQIEKIIACCWFDLMSRLFESTRVEAE